MNVHFRGGKVRDDERLEKWTDDWTYHTAPKFRQIGPYKFKLNPVGSLDGGLIFDCLNESIEPCEECHGHGRLTCEACDGTGLIDCEFCEGEGTVEPPETKREITNRKLQEERKLLTERDQMKLDLK